MVGLVAMRKVHPGACVTETAAWERSNAAAAATHEAAVLLTVWKKSLLPNCMGFTVFDTNRGNLVFRVDNYVAGNKDHILLMDAAGTPLLTIRRKVILSSPSSSYLITYHHVLYQILGVWHIRHISHINIRMILIE